MEQFKKIRIFIIRGFMPLWMALLSGWLIMCTASNTSAAEQIQVNQVGFLPHGPKFAAVPRGPSMQFRVVDMKTEQIVFTGNLEEGRYWDMSETVVRLADFSELHTPGTYRVEIEGARASAPFMIDDNVYSDVLKASIKAYYFNRASTALEEPHAGQYARPEGHPDTVVYVHESAADKQRPTGTIISSPKGWYDAGDFNKYIVNSGITMFTLLKALKHFEEIFHASSLNIPESGNGLPDLLNEILWNLDWMETMQDPRDGGVYHKLTTLHFAKKEMPHEQTAPRYVVQKSTAATLDFAAVMALSSRVLTPYENQLNGRVERWRTAAKKAWKWARKHPRQFYEQPPDVFTGKYAFPDETLKDEWLWAACEMYLLTLKPSYRQLISIPKTATVPGWSRVATLGLFSLLDDSNVTTSLRHRAEQTVLTLADQIAEEHNRSAYGVAMTRSDFIWGSNSEALNKSMVLVYAQRLQPKDVYRTAIQALVDYVLGRNPTGYSFITGFGSKPPMNIHHRVSQSDGVDAPIPGFLVGGPQPGWQDACTYETKVPALTYKDDWCSYSTNEVAINWNAPLVYMLAAISN